MTPPPTEAKVRAEDALDRMDALYARIDAALERTLAQLDPHDGDPDEQHPAH